MTPLSPPFGTYALPPAQEAWRNRAGNYADTRYGRMMISRARKKALAGQSEPIDVEIEPGVKARLYPSTNRCEKRAFAGVQTWDAAERAALKRAVETSPSDRPFVFLDVGANVGLYSLFVNAYTRSADRDAQIIAIEPGLETCARLEANIAASEASVLIVRAAVSDIPGSGTLSGGDGNRGEARLTPNPDGGETVVIDTLTRICRVQGIAHIDAMKLDIEGHDFKALSGFFEDAAPALHPSLLILETGNDKASPLVELCTAHDYMLSERAGLNTIWNKNV